MVCWGGGLVAGVVLVCEEAVVPKLECRWGGFNFLPQNTFYLKLLSLLAQSRHAKPN